MPVTAYNFLQSIELLARASGNLADQCVDGLKATDKGPEMVERGLAIVTTLVPHIGYDASAAIAHKAQATGQTVLEIAIVETNLEESELREILNPESMTEPGVSGMSVG